MITAATSPPTAFAVSGIGVVVLVRSRAIFRVVPDTPRVPPGWEDASRTSPT